MNSNKWYLNSNTVTDLLLLTYRNTTEILNPKKQFFQTVVILAKITYIRHLSL